MIKGTQITIIIKFRFNCFFIKLQKTELKEPVALDK
jgi:hypothetical protein